MFCTQQQFQQLKKYTSTVSLSSTNQHQSISSILQIGNDLVNSINKSQNPFFLNISTGATKNKDKMKQFPTQNRSNTERPRRNLSSQSRQNFQCSQDDDWISLHDYKSKPHFKIPIFNFTEDDIQKSQYVPIYKHKQNPQIHKNKQISSKVFLKEDIKKQPKRPKLNNNNKTHNQNINMNQISHNSRRSKSPKLVKNSNNAVSSSLLNTTKKFKKHIVQAIQQKKKHQQEELNKILQYRKEKHQKLKLNDFYKKNNNHVPIYQKSKQLRRMKQSKLQQSRINKQLNQLVNLNFKPQIDKKTQKIVQGTSFQQRLEQSNLRAQKNKLKTIFQTLKDYPFNPKLNTNNLAESKIRKIWMTQQQDANINYQQNDEQNYQNYQNIDLALKLTHQEKDYLFKSK